ncbi:TolC family protein [Tundrisphaera lichenicola]|uniref:TolC family protein n=1 Tax=Tundrisphaera lichenicola TaxID=2029860 RepID=UPI003EC13A2A
MKPALALLALALAQSLGGMALADDTSRPAPAGLFGRLRKPKPAEVPSTAPRPTPSPGLPQANTKPEPKSGRLRPIPAGPSTAPDAPVRRTQATSADLGMPIGPAAASTAPAPGGQSLSLQLALSGALTSNPDLVTLREGNPVQASAESVEVARHFPTALNPTVFIDYRPITLIPRGIAGSGLGGGTNGHDPNGNFYRSGQGYFLIAIRQPIEFGHQTTHRYGIAKAAYKQVQWQIVQAELTTLVQTYRFFQTAAYRREKLRVARDLSEFSEKLLETLERRLGANQAQPADVALARVESRAAQQQVEAARQDYVTALTDLRNQIGIPESAAESEPLGEFTLPENIPTVDEQTMVQTALKTRPEIHVAQAAIEGATSAVRLAKGDRIPTTIFGPQYVQSEGGVQYVGFNLAPSLPLLNNGKPLVRQREAEQRRAVVSYQQIQQKVTAQVRSAVAKWNGATVLVNDSAGLIREISDDVASLERLFEANQTDLTRVQQARQRLIQLENSQLDALWAATQAQADLMLALGVPSMIQSLLESSERDAGVAPDAPTAPGTEPPAPPTPSPFAPATR